MMSVFTKRFFLRIPCIDNGKDVNEDPFRILLPVTLHESSSIIICFYKRAEIICRITRQIKFKPVVSVNKHNISEPNKILIRHSYIHIVIPRNKPVMSNCSYQRATYQCIVDAILNTNIMNSLHQITQTSMKFSQHIII